MEIIYIANDQLFELRNLKRKDTGAFVNTATVTVTVKTTAGAEVGGTVWPKTLSYIASSNGRYLGTVPYGISLSEGTEYRAHIVADGAGYHGEWNLPLVAKLRTEA